MENWISGRIINIEILYYTQYDFVRNKSEVSVAE